MRLASVVALLTLSVAGAVSPVALPVPEIQNPVALTAVTHVNGQVRLAWTEKAANFQLHAAVLSKNGWEQQGGVLNEDPTFNALQLMSRTGPDGRWWLGWAEDAGIAHVDSWLMRVWDGQSWQVKVSAVRRNLSDAGRSRSFDVMKNGVPTLLWTDLAVPGAWAASVRPLRWDGKTWLPDAVLSDIKFAGFAPDVRVGPGGLRTVVFLEGNYASMNVVVMRETLPDRWERLRPPLNRTPGSFTTQPRLNLTPFGQTVVAWIEGGDEDPDRVFVSRWNGRAWQRLGGALSAGNEMAETLALALGHDGQPRAAWLADGKLRAAQWTGSHWEALTLPGTRNVTGVSLSEDGEFLAASVNGKLHLWNWP
ncbi:hypothetical protein ACFOPQ_10815 [Deinococcus antarcticus]|uniref:Uncharacterized protein n=1 Tax=Deinococcus antarcticus TaxID=1298767 RepID=A0ABV8AAN7_9DEIO